MIRILTQIHLPTTTKEIYPWAIYPRLVKGDLSQSAIYPRYILFQIDLSQSAIYPRFYKFFYKHTKKIDNWVQICFTIGLEEHKFKVLKLYGVRRA